MTEWKARANQLFRELGAESPLIENERIREEFQSLGGQVKGFPEVRDSISLVLIQLAKLCKAAHESQDRDSLEKIYAFVKWCWDKQMDGEEDLQNAVGVSFCEHIISSPAVRRDLPEWFTPEIYNAVKGLFACGVFISTEEWEELRHRCAHLE